MVVDLTGDGRDPPASAAPLKAAEFEAFGATQEQALTCPLPARTRLLLQGGYVMTMDEAGDLPGADVLISDGSIAAIGRCLPEQGAEIIDARDFIVMPGLIDTHWHMWTTLMRSLGGCGPSEGYFQMTRAVSTTFRPADMYLGVLLSAAEALNNGITTVHDWCHNIQSFEHAEADLRALAASGLRGRFSYGATRTTSPKQPVSIPNLERLNGDWASYNAGGLLDLGLAWRGVQTTVIVDGHPTVEPVPDDVYLAEVAAARGMGLPLSVHANSSQADVGHIAAMHRLGLLSNDLQIIHGVTSTPEEIRLLAAAGASASFSPLTELRIGFGFPKILDFADAGVTVGLSIDSTPLAGSADMFSVMKVSQNIENGRAQNEFRMSPRRALEFATTEGACSLGLAKRIGTLTPGKRADIILIDTGALNMTPFTDPAYMVVDGAQPANVDTVIVDGRVLKRDGRLSCIDTRRLVAAARAASGRICRVPGGQQLS
jgi:5-methylthioadenosine/S-adenosylhomocysteine deaminase